MVDFDIVHVAAGAGLRRVQHQEQMATVTMNLRHLIVIRGVPNREWMKPERRAQRLLGLLIPHRYVNPDQPIGSGQQRGQLTDIPHSTPQHNETDVHVGLLWPRALRAITPAWCWDNLNRFDNFGSFNKAVDRIGYFSEYLRSNGAGAGEDTAVLDRSTATGFAGIAAQARSRSRMRLIGGRGNDHRTRRRRQG
jgi:hypothetical protein